MEIHVQQCQSCGSDHLKNILQRSPGEPERVYVQCQSCKAFVASYIMAPVGYYHHGKGFESFVRSIFRSGEFMSGRKVSQLFEERKEEELQRFNELLVKLNEKEAKQKASEQPAKG